MVILQQRTSIKIPAILCEMMLFRKPILTWADVGPTADIIRGDGLSVVVWSADYGRMSPA